MTTKASQRFDVDSNGMRSLHADRRPHELIKELIQNVFDEDTATKCEVKIEPDLAGIRVTVTDDGAGFADVADAYTIMGETAKRRDPTKRGRFNLGEKEVISVAIEAKIETVGTTIHFPAEGGREIAPNRRKKGTQIQAVMPWDTRDAEQLAQRLTYFKAPEHITFTINGKEPAKPPVKHIARARLPTIVQEEDGGPMKTTRRMTDLQISDRVADVAHIYEMGIPIQEIDVPYDVNILQKVPMPPNRDTVSDAYLKKVYSLVLAQVHEDMEAESFSETWVREAIEDPEITEDAVKTTIKSRYGDKVVTWSSNTQSNMDALDKGYQVIHPRSLSQNELKNLRQKGGLQSSHALFSDRTNNEPAIMESEEGNPARIGFTKWAKQLASAAGFSVTVEYVRDSGAKRLACCTMNSRNPTMRFNTHHLDDDFFQGRGAEQIAIIVHELGHSEADGGTDHGPTWGNCCADVAGRIIESLRKEA